MGAAVRRRTGDSGKSRRRPREFVTAEALEVEIGRGRWNADGFVGPSEDGPGADEFVGFPRVKMMHD